VTDELSDLGSRLSVVAAPGDGLGEDAAGEKWSSRARHPAAAHLREQRAAGTAMVAVAAALTGRAFVPKVTPLGAGVALIGRRRGGNRLPVDHPAYGRTHRYERCRQLPPDPEKRNRNQRHRTRVAAATALRLGELDKIEHEALMVMLELTDETCQVTYHGLEAIAEAAGGYGVRTVCGWLARLRQRGWLHRAHRFIVADGRVVGTSNQWRIDIPAHLRAERYAVEAQSRAKKRAETAARRGKSGRFTPPAHRGAPDGPGPVYEDAEARRLAREAEAAASPPITAAERERHFADARRELARQRRVRQRDRAPP
jgi:hypothetical protein